MAVEAVGKVFTIVKYGADAIEFIKRLNDRTVVMKCRFPTDPSSNTIVFEAFDNRSWKTKVLSPVPAYGIHLPFKKLFDPNPNEPPDEEPNRFKFIEIECNDKNEFRRLMGEYRGRSEIPQASVIELLKIIDG